VVAVNALWPKTIAMLIAKAVKNHVMPYPVASLLLKDIA
jgi:hypothetical protein